MKCDNCQTEIEQGMVYCPNCGKPLQLVPNYNELEEELLSKIVEDKDSNKKFATGVYKPVKVPIKTSTDSSEKTSYKQPKKKSSLVMMGFVIAVVTLIIGLIVGISRYNYTHTYDYRMMLGNQAYNEENYTDAISYYSEADSTSSTFDSTYRLGLSYYHIGEYSEAAEYFIKALDYESDNADIYNCLLKCYDKLGDEDAIYALYESAPNDDIKLTISGYIILPPDFSLEDGEYDTVQTLHITSIDDFAIYYTLDGKDPTKYGKLYKTEIELEEGTTTVKAVCLSDDGKYSDVVTKTYDIVIKNPDKPEVSLLPGTYTFPTFMTVSNLPENCKCYYSFNAASPNQSSMLYDGGIKIPYGTNTIYIIYIDDEGLCSEIYEGVYTCQ